MLHDKKEVDEDFFFCALKTKKNGTRLFSGSVLIFTGKNYLQFLEELEPVFFPELLDLLEPEVFEL